LNLRCYGVGQSIAAKRPLSRKKPAGARIHMEQIAVVAALSQLLTITAPALPRSNQIEAMLFGLVS
jgi:hypothetical protein